MAKKPDSWQLLPLLDDVHSFDVKEGREKESESEGIACDYYSSKYL